MRIALVEDNAALARGIAYRLQDVGHSVDLLSDGDDAARHLAREGADLILLDINLPGQDGLSLLRTLRQSGDSTPVIVLTARGDTKDRVSGLDAGADDYLVKPFEMDELEARVRALARRRGDKIVPLVAIGDLQFDTAARQILQDGQPMNIPRREISVFECLLAARGRLVSKSALVDHVYGVGADIDENVVQIYVSRLRKRLKDHRIQIKMTRGMGYVMDSDG